MKKLELDRLKPCPFCGGDDYISRQAAIAALGEEPQCWIDAKYNCGPRDQWRWDIKSISEVPAANVRPVVRGHWIESKKHLWERDEGGNVDLFRWERDYHNGPVCMKCRRCPCVNCRPDYDDEECYKPHFICSVCGRAELKKEPFCNCGTDMREREDNND